MHPLFSFFRFLYHILRGRLHFPKTRTGQALTMEDGQVFTIFREAIITAPDAPAPAVFRVRFHVAGMTPRQNIRFSLLPIPFFTGLPGFRRKLWTLNPATGDFQGIYEWQTESDARNYAQSFAMRFMTRRSQPGSATFDILPGVSLHTYLDTLGASKI